MALHEEWEVLGEVGILCSNGNDEEWGIWPKLRKNAEFFGCEWKDVEEYLGAGRTE